MLRRFSLGIKPSEIYKAGTKVCTCLLSTFRRVNLSLASCSSAELASVSVQNKIHNIKLYLQLVEKASHIHWVSFDTGNSNILSNNIYDFQIDKENNVWLSCQGGISKYNGSTFFNYPHSTQGYLAVQDSTNIWLGYSGLEHFNPFTGISTYYNTGNSNIPSDNVSCIAIDNNGIIWLGFSFAFNGGLGNGGTNGGLATFDGTTFTTIWPFNSPYTGVYGLTIDATNNVWVSTRCEGLYKYDGVSWTNISGVPLSGCSFCVQPDQQNYIWYTEVYSGVWTNNPSVGIKEFSGKCKVRFFPNPVIDYIKISLCNTQQIEVLNIFGESILKKDFSLDLCSEGKWLTFSNRLKIDFIS